MIFFVSGYTFFDPKKVNREHFPCKITFFQLKGNLLSKHGVFQLRMNTFFFLAKLLFSLSKDPFQVVNMEFVPLDMKCFQAKILFQFTEGDDF